jgi:hypothetical protein
LPPFTAPLVFVARRDENLPARLRTPDPEDFPPRFLRFAMSITSIGRVARSLSGLFDL